MGCFQMVLLPTLNRTSFLKNFFQSYRETSAIVPVMALVDEVDYQENKAEYDCVDYPVNCFMYNTGSAITMGDKVRRCWGRVKEDHPKWVGILNDDHYCITPEWDKRVEEMLDGTNMVSTNDGNWNFGFRCCGLTAWSMPLLDAAGFPIFPRNLHHYFIDDCWKVIGESSGCWLETMKINIEHRHVLNGKMPADDTFKKVNEAKANLYDQNEFKHFMEQDFKDVVMRIVELRSSQVQENKFA